MMKADKLNSVSHIGKPASQQQRPLQVSGDHIFADALEQAQKLKFSNHAQKRLQKREIHLSDDGLNRLEEAVDKAEKRGGRESLILMDGMAFIVNVQNRIVVTAVDPRSRGEGVFTQIDSVVLANEDQGTDRST